MGSSQSAQNDSPSRLNVVIIGGGYAGLTLAYDLRQQNLCDVTLIDAKDVMIHYVAALRSAVVKGMAQRIVIPYHQVIQDSFVRGRVESVNTEKKFVKLQDGSRVLYSHLVIATGSSSNFPQKAEFTEETNFLNEYQIYRKQISRSRRVLVVGGGAVGVEMCGEIKEKFPQCEVTIISRNDVLVSPRTNSIFQTRLKKLLEKKDVKLITGDRVLDLEKASNTPTWQVVSTENGLQLEVDMVIQCTGSKPSTHFCKDGLGKSMNRDGHLCVDEFFRVKGHDDVYAIGDVTDLDEEKSALNARMHAKLLATNLTRVMEMKDAKKYQPFGFMMLVSLGKDHGLCQLHGKVFGSFATRLFKGNDLQINTTWKRFGLIPPVPPPRRKTTSNSAMCCVAPQLSS